MLALIATSCNSDKLINEAEKIYLNIKTKDLDLFKNWNIYLRDGKDNVYLIDNIINDSIESRFLLVTKDSIIYKEILPDQDSVFHKLNTEYFNNNMEQQKELFELFVNFKSLGVEEIYYRDNDSIFLIKSGKTVLLYNIGKNEDFIHKKPYNNYKKIEANWYFYQEK
jgi:hypothetical protein